MNSSFQDELCELGQLCNDTKQSLCHINGFGFILLILIVKLFFWGKALVQKNGKIFPQNELQSQSV